MQETIVILIVSACAAWAAWQGYRFFKPAPKGRHCAGNCCDTAAAPPQTPTTPRTQMISSDALRARIAARR